MPTLRDIQVLVNEAQSKIKEGNSVHVKTVIWPEIKTKLGQTTDLEWRYRGDMAKLIYQRLDEQDLQGGAYTTINVGQLKVGLEAGSVQVPQPAQAYRWLPW